MSDDIVSARMNYERGELDAASAYKIQPGPFNLPFLTLPPEINLGNESMHDRYAQTSIDLGGKTYRPQSLVYYAAVLDGSAHKDKAAAFVAWLTAGAQPIFRQFFYDQPAGAAPLHV